MTFFRRRPLFSAILSGAVSWVLSGWWWGTVQCCSLSLGRGESCCVLGLAEDGSLLGAERTPHTAEWSVWKRRFPDGGRDDIWHTAGLRKEPPEDVSFRLQPGGRWLFVTKLGSQGQPQTDPVIDLRTGKVYPGQDTGMRWVTPDGSCLLTADVVGGIRVDELATGREIGRVEDEWIDAMSADGRWVAAETDSTLRVWNIAEDGVRPTGLSCPVAAAPASRLGALNDAEHQPTCQFSSDSQRFLVFGAHRLDVYDLQQQKRIAQHRDPSPVAISRDGRRAYERNGHVFDTVSGATLVAATGWRNDIDGLRTPTDGWFISRRNPQMSWWGRGWPGAQFRLGPYTVAISADNSLENVGCDIVDADHGRRRMLPQWFLPSTVSPGGFREEWSLYTHPQRVAFHNAESGLVRVLEMPPVDTTLPRVLTALALFAFPGAWCGRNWLRSELRGAIHVRGGQGMAALGGGESRLPAAGR